MSVFRKAMVCLGLVDDDEYYGDDDEYYDDDAYDDAAPSGPPAPIAPRASRPPAPRRARPSPVTVIRSRRDREEPDAARRRARAPSRGDARSRCPTTRVHVMEPHGFNDAQEVGDRLKAGQPVILNLQGVDRDLQRRLIDFSSGLAYALSGTMSKAADQVFLLTPSNVEVSEEEKERLQARGLYRARPRREPSVLCALDHGLHRRAARCARSCRGSRSGRERRSPRSTVLLLRSHRAGARAAAPRDPAGRACSTSSFTRAHDRALSSSAGVVCRDRTDVRRGRRHDARVTASRGIPGHTVVRMEITPRELRDVEIAEAFRGYNRDVVNDLLERAAATHRRRATNGCSELSERLNAAQVEAGRSRETEDILHRTLLLAQRAADEAVAEATAEGAPDDGGRRARSRTSCSPTPRPNARRKGETERRRLEEEVIDLAGRRDTLLADVDALTPLRGRLPRTHGARARSRAVGVEESAIRCSRPGP